MKRFNFIAGVVIIVLFNIAFIKPESDNTIPNPPYQKVKVSTESNITPIAFPIKAYTSLFESLNEEYSTPLLSAYENDMTNAYQEWQSLVHALEVISKEENVNIEGLKMWTKVFWRENGQIDYIAFELKPQSKLIEMHTISKLLTKLTKTYKASNTSVNKFSHYGSASYPTKSSYVSLN